MRPPSEPSGAAPSSFELFSLFCRVGLTSFGGGTSSWLYRRMVLEKGWVPEDEFLDALALCQALPGINITNIAVWMGRRLCGMRGVLSALAGIVILPSILIVCIAMLFVYIARFPLTEVALTGATAAAIGLPFSMGLTLVMRVRRGLIPLGLMAATFICVALLKIPLVWVVLACGGFGVGWEYFRRETA
jgi:chromate transporter